MRIALDIDGVLADFRAGLRLLLAERGWTAESMPDSSDWAFYTCWGLPKSSFYRHLQEGRVFSMCPPMPGAHRAVKLLQAAGHEVHLVTARHDHTREVTEEWLVDHHFAVDGLHFESVKSTVDLDLYVDDKPSVIAELREAGKPAVVFDQLWNRHVEGPRLLNWDDAGQLLRVPSRT